MGAHLPTVAGQGCLGLWGLQAGRGGQESCGTPCPDPAARGATRAHSTSFLHVHLALNPSFITQLVLPDLRPSQQTTTCAHLRPHTCVCRYYEPLARVASSVEEVVSGPPLRKLLFMTSPHVVDRHLRPHWEVRPSFCLFVVAACFSAWTTALAAGGRYTGLAH